jgi:hypothetical protein
MGHKVFTTRDHGGLERGQDDGGDRVVIRLGSPIVKKV